MANGSRFQLPPIEDMLHNKPFMSMPSSNRQGSNNQINPYSLHDTERLQYYHSSPVRDTTASIGVNSSAITTRRPSADSFENPSGYTSFTKADETTAIGSNSRTAMPLQQHTHHGQRTSHSRSFSDQMLRRSPALQERKPTYALSVDPPHSLHRRAASEVFNSSSSAAATAGHKRPRSMSHEREQEQPSKGHPSPSPTHINNSSHRYRCNECYKTFSRPSSLRIHILSHTGEKPHVCPQPECGRRFSVQSNMRRHLKVHYCNNSSNSASQQPQHQNQQTFMSRLQ